MLNRGKLAGAAVGAFGLLVAGAASAKTFDFVNLANSYWNDNNTEATWAQAVDYADGNANADDYWDGTLGGTEEGGLEVLATGLRWDENAPAGSRLKDTASDGTALHAFLDANTGARDAGLGVCSSGINGDGKSLCSTGVSGATTSDDNVDFPEVLMLSFGQKVTLNAGVIRDKDHYLADSGGDRTFGFFVATVGTPGDIPSILETTDFIQCAVAIGVLENCTGANSTLTGVIGNTFLFSPDMFAATANTEGYLASVTATAVPLPAAAWLFGSAILGLAGIGYRSKREA